jgi:hypothetical protein
MSTGQPTVNILRQRWRKNAITTRFGDSPKWDCRVLLHERPHSKSALLWKEIDMSLAFLLLNSGN